MSAYTLKDLLKSDRILKIMGCHTPLGAKIAEEIKFDGVWFSGFEFATSNCVPDASILTMTDNLSAISSITRTINVPLIADCDSGFGDLNNVIHMVKEYERSGVNAVSIEDKVFPKLNSFCQGAQELLSIKEFSTKIIAAVDARISDQFLIIARIESLIAGLGINDALERAYAYKEAGADAILIHSKSNTPIEIIEFCKKFEIDIPLIIIPTTYPQFSLEEIAKVSKKIKMVIYANHGIRAAIKAMKEAYSNIQEYGSTLCLENDICSMKEAFGYQNMPSHIEHYDRYNELANTHINKE